VVGGARRPLPSRIKDNLDRFLTLPVAQTAAGRGCAQAFSGSS
jgi:hypothetical protein